MELLDFESREREVVQVFCVFVKWFSTNEVSERKEESAIVKAYRVENKYILSQIISDLEFHFIVPNWKYNRHVILNVYKLKLIDEQLVHTIVSAVPIDKRSGAKKVTLKVIRNYHADLVRAHPPTLVPKKN